MEPPKYMALEDITELELRYLEAKAALVNITYSGGYPAYPQSISLFFHQCLSTWSDSQYKIEEASKKVEQIETASWLELRSILTLFMRGERFSDGYWISVLESSDIDRIIRRAKILIEESS